MDSSYDAICKIQENLVSSISKVIDSYNFDWAERIVNAYNYDALAAIQATFESIQERYDKILQIPEFYQSLQEAINRTSDMYSAKIEESISLALKQSSFSSLSDNITIHDDYVELNEAAVDILSPFVELPVIESSTADAPVDNPAPAKYKMSRAELINILIAIIFGIAGLLLDYSQGRNDSIAQQQQWEIENEQREESNYLQYLDTIQNAEIIDLLKELLETQETAPANPSVPDQGEELLGCAQESADHTQSPADDAQTVPDESCAQQPDEQ